MNQTLSLLKVLFKQNYRKGKGVERSKKGKIGMALLYTFCVVALAPYLIISLVTLSKLATNANMGREYISILMVGIQGIALIFGTITLVNIMYLSTDSEILSSLPIPNRKVFTAKFLYVLIQELVLGGIIGFTGVIIYGIMSQANVAFYLLGALAVIISPVLSLAVASLLLLPIVLMIAKLRKYPIVAGLISLLLFGGGMYLYMAFVMGISAGAGSGVVTNTAEMLLSSIATYLPFNMVVADVVFLSPNFLTSLLITIAIYGGLFALACILTSTSYKKCSGLVTEKNANKSIKSSNQKNSVKKALIIRDLKSIMRFPMLMMMCVSQIALAPIMVFVMSTVYGEDMALMQFPMMFMMGTMLVCGTNYFATSSFTRENESINILKTLPVSVKTIVSTKLAIAYTVGILTAIATTIVMALVATTLLESALILVYFIILSLGFCAWQVRSDMDKPKLGWSNVNEGIKNNKSATLPIFASMGMGMIGMIVFIVLLSSETLSHLIPFVLIAYIVLSAIFTILQTKSLYKNANKLFAKIEY